MSITITTNQSKLYPVSSMNNYILTTTLFVLANLSEENTLQIIISSKTLFYSDNQNLYISVALRFLRGKNRISQNRIYCQLIHEMQSKYFRQFYSGSTKWFHRVFGAEFEDASGNNKIQEYLGKRQLQQQDDVEGAFRIDVMEFTE
ncbi:Hypothetical_protein [Hexamita inflata]|uniref:Hypothetical_protein n=1 Tax=Hexamita inflata TaxID=28002 RepID=A0AA86N725_9EUKA|nr:Hypothetical protein HINF_LOCUS1541 [Hexamita inflata]